MEIADYYDPNRDIIIFCIKKIPVLKNKTMRRGCLFVFWALKIIIPQKRKGYYGYEETDKRLKTLYYFYENLDRFLYQNI